MTAESFAQWSTLLRQSGLGVTPAELHGSMTGLLCTGWHGQPGELLASLAVEGEPADEAAGRELQALLGRAMAGIETRLGAREPVEVLMPDETLALRANALVEWCRGFLGGLGLGGALPAAGQASAAGEWLADFGQIAAMPLVCGEDDGKALDDLLEFVRDGVADLHAAYVRTGRS
jgi:uncharacterized protein YgfB (UPF0149 family)